MGEKVVYDKLVRDLIPNIIEQGPVKAHFRRATGDVLRHYLIKKLGEEIAEFANKPSIEEMADLLEVADRICQSYAWGATEIFDARIKKNEIAGSFAEGIILEYVEEK